MKDYVDPEITPSCSQWQLATLVGCSEAGVWESIRLRIHALSCKSCRSRLRESNQVTKFLAARMGPATSGNLVIPARRLYVISLGVALAALALSSAYQVTYGSDSNSGIAVKNEDCAPAPKVTVAPLKEECDGPGPKKPSLQNH